MAELKPCGTRAAYVRHIRRGEPVDEACKAANAERTRTFYATSERYHTYVRCYQAALLELIRRHRDAYLGALHGERTAHPMADSSTSRARARHAVRRLYLDEHAEILAALMANGGER